MYSKNKYTNNDCETYVSIIQICQFPKLLVTKLSGYPIVSYPIVSYQIVSYQIGSYQNVIYQISQLFQFSIVN